MADEILQADYLVVGAGAMGLAFIDELLTRVPDAQIVLVDQHPKPGGHWRDAYSFVSLHQPAAYYGVNSAKLGKGGPALASGSDVLTYYDKVTAKLLATGQVQYFPHCEYHGDGHFTSLEPPHQSYQVEVRRKTVDGTYLRVAVPATSTPMYEVSEGVRLVPPNELPKLVSEQVHFAIIGAGKTGIDAIHFLLEQGVDPDNIRWIISHDSWLLIQSRIQPGKAFDWLINQMEVLVKARSLDEAYLAIEERGIMTRLDKSVWPTRYRCATVSQKEIDDLHAVHDLVRLGRVQKIELDTVVLDKGTLPAEPNTVYVHCSADGLPKRLPRPVFKGPTITLQSLLMCQQVFSAALIAYVESHYDDEKLKNELCQAIPHPETSRDYLAAAGVSLANLIRWDGELRRWMFKSRLSYYHHESFLKLLLKGGKVRHLMTDALANMKVLYEKEFPGQDFPGGVL